MTSQNFELSDMGGEYKSSSSSPWGGISSKRRAGSGSMNTGLLSGGDGVNSPSSSSSPPAQREALRSLLDTGRPTVVIHPCIICCTIFSIISAICLLLLGIYGAADGEGKYLILVEGGGKESGGGGGGSRGAQVGHIIGASIVYALFAAGCGFRWWKKSNPDTQRGSFLTPSFD